MNWFESKKKTLPRVQKYHGQKYSVINSLGFNAPGSYSQGFTFLDIRNVFSTDIILHSIIIETAMVLVGDPAGSARQISGRMNIPLNQSPSPISRFATQFNTQTVSVIPDRVQVYFDYLNLGYGKDMLLSSGSIFFYTVEPLANITRFEARMNIMFSTLNE